MSPSPNLNSHDECPESRSGDVSSTNLQRTVITDELTSLDRDLDQRSSGALFALNPGNPDAARQFCTSARELMVRLLEAAAPTAAVIEENPHWDRTAEGEITRRARVEYCLRRAQAYSPELTEFVDADIANVMSLFREFNDGTHGSAVRFAMNHLVALKSRVEGAIQFIHRLAFG